MRRRTEIGKTEEGDGRLGSLGMEEEENGLMKEGVREDRARGKGRQLVLMTWWDRTQEKGMSVRSTDGKIEKTFLKEDGTFR